MVVVDNQDHFSWDNQLVVELQKAPVGNQLGPAVDRKGEVQKEQHKIDPVEEDMMYKAPGVPADIPLQNQIASYEYNCQEY